METTSLARFLNMLTAAVQQTVGCAIDLAFAFETCMNSGLGQSVAEAAGLLSRCLSCYLGAAPAIVSNACRSAATAGGLSVSAGVMKTIRPEAKGVRSRTSCTIDIAT
ncbi:hypothetical protein D9M68_406000 [compost metagenome]